MAKANINQMNVGSKRPVSGCAVAYRYNQQDCGRIAIMIRRSARGEREETG